MIKRLICKESYLRSNREFIEGNVYLADFNAHYDDLQIEYTTTVFVFVDSAGKDLGLYFTTNEKGEDNYVTFSYLWNTFETEQQNRKKKLEKINKI